MLRLKSISLFSIVVSCILSCCSISCFCTPRRSRYSFTLFTTISKIFTFLAFMIAIILSTNCCLHVTFPSSGLFLKFNTIFIKFNDLIVPSCSVPLDCDIQLLTSALMVAYLPHLPEVFWRVLRELPRYMNCKWQLYRSLTLIFRGVSVSKTLADLKCFQSLDLKNLLEPVRNIFRDPGFGSF